MIWKQFMKHVCRGGWRGKMKTLENKSAQKNFKKIQYTISNNYRWYSSNLSKTRSILIIPLLYLLYVFHIIFFIVYYFIYCFNLLYIYLYYFSYYIFFIIFIIYIFTHVCWYIILLLLLLLAIHTDSQTTRCVFLRIDSQCYAANTRDKRKECTLSAALAYALQCVKLRVPLNGSSRMLRRVSIVRYRKRTAFPSPASNFPADSRPAGRNYYGIIITRTIKKHKENNIFLRYSFYWIILTRNWD